MQIYRKPGFKAKVSNTFGLTLLGIFVLGITGWIMNIYKLATESPFILDGETILRVVGIFIAPLGAIMGWFV